MVRTNPVGMSIADYCSAYNRGEIKIDRKYQRSAGVWPERAQSYLVETILRGFPIPKLAIHQQTDLKSKETIKWVVDGQQRTIALVNFFNGNLRLSRRLELPGAGGRTYDELSDDLRSQFISYLLQFDQFEAVGEETVREYFRRINAFSAPLNSEEKRNADYQGNMKWLILRLTDRHSDTLVSLRTLTEREVIRMADDKLMAELVHALINGITTTTASSLNKMYKEYDRNIIQQEEAIEEAIDGAFNHVQSWPQIRGTALVTKTHIFYSLILAIIGTSYRWPTLQVILNPPNVHRLSSRALPNLLELADALASDGQAFDEFVSASAEKTNTKAQRETRVRWLATALTQDAL